MNCFGLTLLLTDLKQDCTAVSEDMFEGGLSSFRTIGPEQAFSDQISGHLAARHLFLSDVNVSYCNLESSYLATN